MQKELDTFLISIDDKFSDGEDLGIEQIAFVDSPAIMIKGMAFNSQVKILKFSDGVKMRIAAPALIPGEIYRCDEDGYEYNVKFTEDIIEQLYTKFMMNLTNKNIFNLEHNADVTVPAYVLESILVDSENKIKMIKDEYKIDLPLGSVFIVSQITNKEYYDYLVANEKYAYSIEGFLGMDLIKTKMSEIQNKNKNKNQKMEDLKLPTGEQTIGDKIYVIDEAGKIVEIKDVVKAEEVAPIVEEVKAEEEVKEVTPEVEEVKAEEVAPIVEEKKEEVSMEIDEAALMTILQPKLDEIYAMIAEVKAGLATKETEEIETVAPIAMSAIEKRVNFAQSFFKK